MAKRDLGDVAVTALTRPGVGLALLAALGVYLVLAAQILLGSIGFVLATYLQDAGSYLALILPNTLPLAFGPPLPFAIGVFLSFWQLAPVAPQLRMAHVVTRALLAAVVGFVATVVIGFLVAVALNLASADFASIGSNIVDAVRSALPGALNILIQGFVVVPLAALLLWGRLQASPPKTTPAGALDDV